MHYPSESATLSIDTQFFFGPSLLVSPVTTPDATSVSFYLPKDIFYDFATGKQMASTGAQVTYGNVPFTDIPVHVKGGAIVPMRVAGANTTTALRDNDFELLVAPDADGNAWGTLYLDDGVSIAPDHVSEIEFRLETKSDGRWISMMGSFGYQTKVRVKGAIVMGKDGSTKSELDMELDGPWAAKLA